MNLKFIDEVREGKTWKLWSMRVNAAGAALPIIWAGLPQTQQEALLDVFGLKGLVMLVAGIAAITNGLAMALRVLKQVNLDQPK